MTINKKTILVLDTPMVLNIAKLLLSNDYNVIEASTGKYALSKLDEPNSNRTKNTLISAPVKPISCKIERSIIV